MNQHQVYEKIAALLHDRFGVPKEKISRQAVFRTTLGLDSLSLVNLIYLFHQTFGVTDQVATYHSLDTVSAVVNFIHRYQQT